MHLRKLILPVLLLCSVQFPTFSQQRNLLSGRYSTVFVNENIVSAEDYKPLPPCGDQAWNVIPEEERQAILKKAEGFLGYDVPPLKASVYLDFIRNGNRSVYEGIYFTRRRVLSYLLMGEILENKGRFIDDIVNVVWAICEESSWTVPAHIGLQQAGSGLPDKDEPVVALFSAETGSLMAAVDYFCGDKLDEVSPLIRKRIQEEVKTRILDPVLMRDDFWWMGLTGRVPNNWNPWIVSNWINTALVLEKDPDRRAESIHKAMYILDQFLNPYPSDGGCDEGPGYWSQAGGSLFDCLNELYLASNGKIDIFSEPLIRNIGDYIWKVYIDHNWFVNFADAPAIEHPNPLMMYRFGKATGSENLMAFAAMMYKSPDSHEGSLGSYGLMIRTLPDFFAIPETGSFKTGFDPGSTNTFNDLEVFTAREFPGKYDGFYLAAKGGNNNESHNHNDVGNFIVYLNGAPLILDAGVGTYTAKTFSAQRYDIWTMQSAYHNLPDINGVMQHNGAEYKAEDVRFIDSQTKPGFSLDIAHAYPPGAGILEARRTLLLDRKHHRIDLSDVMTFQHAGNEVSFHFMTRQKPDLRSGRAVFTDPGTGAEIAELIYPEDLEPSIDEVTLDDRRLSGVWGNSLYRVTLRARVPGTQASFSFRIDRK